MLSEIDPRRTFCLADLVKQTRLLPFICAAACLCLISVPAAEWSERDGYRSLPVAPKGAANGGFTIMPSSITGISFTNRLEGDMFLTNAVAHNGAGLAIGDIDGDSLPDIYVCSLQGPNALFRNKGGWRFERLDPGAAACADQLSTGATFADVDGDRDLDLLVNGIAAGTRLFLNDGTGRWVESTHAGLSRTNSATSMALADIDRDGDLDLYCAHYIDVMHLADPTTAFALGRRGDKWEVIRVNSQSTGAPKWKDRFEALPDGSVRELPETHALYRNDGNGRFTAIQNEPGVFQDANGKPIPPFRDWGLAVMFRDFNRDGSPDFYVCNDNASPDRFWINNGKGTFRLASSSILRHTSRSSMGLDFADVDRDGHDDFIVVDMLARTHAKRMMQLVREYPDAAAREHIDEQPRYNRNVLFLGRADGSFAEAAFMAGVAASDWSWCPVFLDVDLDGYEDLLVSNGFSFDVMDQDSHEQLRARKLSTDQKKRIRQFHPRFPTVLAAFRNQRNGTFLPATGWGFDQAAISYGMALGDLDADGDMDLVVNQLNGAPAVYRNDAPAPRIAVRLKGQGANTEGIGARIRLAGPTLTQEQELIAGGRYMSGDEPMRVFAAAEQNLRLEVQWPDGKESIITNVQPNHLYEVDQSGSKPRPPAKSAAAKRLFEDQSALLNHHHVENEFDDWTRQPLLPRRLSRQGPGVSWFDLNADGWEDLVVGASRGGKLALFLNQQGTGFSKPVEFSVLAGDQAGVLGWFDQNGNRRLLAATSNLEQSATTESSISILSFENGTLKNTPLNAGKSSIGPLSTADVDGDGDLDLFAGGRVVPGRYPEAADSSLWLNENGELKRSTPHSSLFASAGLVSGATFADLDNDADPDLALALEWGTIRLFRNDSGVFQEITEALGLASLSGWWTSIAAGDFNGDGKVDVAAGNWGLNTPYSLYSGTPLRVYYGDWNANGAVDLLEAGQEQGRWVPLRTKTWLARGIPELAQRFPTHEAFGRGTIPDILGPKINQSRVLAAAHFESSVFINRGARFDRIPLPREAQLTPIFSLSVGDFDNDGVEDLFAGQNFFGAASDLSREDSGQGLLLRGRGDGTFQPMDSIASGIRIHGEQRGSALADFNHDGRVDLVVAQNNAETRLYLNKAERRGLRVSLKGPASNPHAIGALMRVVYADGKRGPIRIVQAGSGYLSQDSSVQVLGLSAPAQLIWIRWPGGKEHLVPITNQDEIEIVQ
jgi:enediyne biosynthesis protein E4